jgi:ribonuclease P protein subunit POP4
MDEMRPVYIDRAHTFVKEEDRKEMQKKLRNKKDRKLTAREKRRLKIYDIPKEAHQYKLFEPLAQLWQGYMSKLQAQGLANFEQKLIKADFHGANMTGKNKSNTKITDINILSVVIQSTNPTYIGTSGIVVQETLSLFKIITKDNKLKRKWN